MERTERVTSKQRYIVELTGKGYLRREIQVIVHCSPNTITKALQAWAAWKKAITPKQRGNVELAEAANTHLKVSLRTLALINSMRKDQERTFPEHYMEGQLKAGIRLLELLIKQLQGSDDICKSKKQ